MTFAAMDAVALGAIIGSVLGIAGGLFGTYAAVRHTRGPLERRFMVRTALVSWSVLVALAVAVLLVPSVRSWGWLPLCALVVFGVPFVNRRQQFIRSHEEKFSPIYNIFV